MILSFTKKEKLLLTGKIIIAGAIMMYLFQKFQSFDYYKIFSVQKLPLMLLVGLLMFINIFVQLSKWKSVFTEMLGEVSNTTLVSSFFVGIATGSFTPGRLGEYFGRSILIKEYQMSEIISASVVDKLANMFVLVFAGLFSTLWFLKVTSVFTTEILLVLSVPLILLLLSSIYLIVQKKAAAYVYKRIERIRFLTKIFFYFQVVKKTTPKTVLVQLGYSLLLYLVIAFQYGVLTASFANKPLEYSFMLAGILTLFVKSFIPSISFGDLGIRESASIFFLSVLGLPAEVGFLSAFSIFLFNIFLPSLVGVIILLLAKR